MKVKRNQKLVSPFFLATLALLVFIGFAASSHPLEGAEVERGFLLFFKFPSMTIGIEEKIDLNLIVVNTGQKEEQILLSVIPEEKAKDWDVGMETGYPRRQVHSVTVLPTEPDDSLALGFYLIPPEDVEEGAYSFIVKGTSTDKKIQYSTTLDIFLQEKEPVSEEISEIIELVVDYPSMENPAPKPFEFVISIMNNTEENMILELGVDIPYGWRARATPRWEDDNISSLKADANDTEIILLTLIPPITVSEGEYPIKFAVEWQDKMQSIDLKAIVTGTYDLKMGTETGLLSLRAIAGEKEIVEIYLWNEGSAPIEDVSFFSLDTPIDWEVSFDPQKIASVPSYNQVDKPEKIELSIVSPPRSLPGDYLVSLRAIGREDQTDMVLRITVGSSTLWGWMGIGIVFVIIASLVGVFVRLGRR